MGNIGGGEIILVLLVALVVLGPQRLPGAMREVGKVAGELRRMSQGFKAELDAAARLTDDDEVERHARERGRTSTSAPVSRGKPPRPVPPPASEDVAAGEDSSDNTTAELTGTSDDSDDVDHGPRD